MPPFNNRRFDPYGNGGGGTTHPTNSTSNSNMNTNSNHPHGPLAPPTRPSALGRTRTLLTSGGPAPSAGRTAGYYGGGGGVTPLRDLDRVGASSFSPSSGAAAATLRPRVRRTAESPYVDKNGIYRDERDAFNDVAGPYGRTIGGMPAPPVVANRRFGTVGAAPLSSHVHPLLAATAGGRSRPRGRTAGAAYGGRDDLDEDDDDDDDSFDGAGRPLPPSRRPRPRSRSRSRGRRPRGRPSPLQRRLAHWTLQSKRILSLLMGQIPEADALALQTQRQRPSKRDDRDDVDPVLNSHGETEEEILLHLLSAKSTARVLRLFLLLPLLYHVSRAVLPPTVDRLTRPAPWSWSASSGNPSSSSGRHRNLAGRNCVMNYFIEKQPPDEYDPDYVEAKPKAADKDGKDGAADSNTKTNHAPPAPSVVVVEGTYRTKGQVHVISRFIEAIADSFRSNTKIRQHLIFAESRDGGHLAHEAIRHWPPRGKFKTMVHVLASEDLPFFGRETDPDDAETRTVARALGYGSLEDIELKFRGNDKARVYDRDGNLAGLPATEGVDDDEVDGLEEMDVPDKETLEFRIRSGKRRRRNADISPTTNSTATSYGYVLPPGIKPYPNLRALLPFEDEDDGEGDIVVPYLHVDGISMGHQMAVLEAARSLLEDQTVVVVGLEHSPDLDVRVLIEFFRQVGYKTFFLGARQIARIDNLCEEVLDDVLEHPSVSAPKAGFWRRAFMRLGWISKDELRIVDVDPKKRKREIARQLKLELASRTNGAEGGGSFGLKRRETPPFFVAMPRGRRSKEEMTIQHMYDLFGGYGGGGGQIKTANDRKAPGK